MTIEQVIMKYEKQLLQLPDVRCVAIGMKSGKNVIKIFVKQKNPENIKQFQHIIPKTLEGYETDIEEIGEVMAHEL